MFKDITIGQYYPENSIVHRLDPRVKLFGVVVYVAAVFIINNLIGFIFLTAAIATLIALSKVPLKHILKGLRFVWFLVILAVFFNLFFSDGTIICAQSVRPYRARAVASPGASTSAPSAQSVPSSGRYLRSLRMDTFLLFSRTSRLAVLYASGAA